MSRVTSSDVLNLVNERFAKTGIRQEADEVRVSLGDFARMAKAFGMSLDQLKAPWFDLATNAGMVRVRASKGVSAGKMLPRWRQV